MSYTVNGQITNGAGANQLVTGAPADWPITNAASQSATDPGIIQALCAADGSWSLPGMPSSTSCTITTPQGTSTGSIPAGNGSISLATLKASNGWSNGGAT